MGVSKIALSQAQNEEFISITLRKMNKTPLPLSFSINLKDFNYNYFLIILAYFHF